MSFDEEVWQLLERIPTGRVATYGGIAVALGKPNAARAVGNACNRNPDSPKVPCHRVVKSNGEISGFAEGHRKKLALLRKEGVIVENNRVLEFEEKLFEF